MSTEDDEEPQADLHHDLEFDEEARFSMHCSHNDARIEDILRRVTTIHGVLNVSVIEIASGEVIYSSSSPTPSTGPTTAAAADDDEPEWLRDADRTLRGSQKESGHGQSMARTLIPHVAGMLATAQRVLRSCSGEGEDDALQMLILSTRQYTMMLCADTTNSGCAVVAIQGHSTSQLPAAVEYRARQRSVQRADDERRFPAWASEATRRSKASSPSK